MRAVMGFALAPLVTPGAVCAVWMGCRYLNLGWIGRMSSVGFDASLEALHLPATVVAYGLTIVGAVPWYIWLSRRSLVTVGRLFSIGLTLGGTAFLPFVVSGRWLDSTIWLVTGVTSGALVSGLFAIIVLWRPTRSSAP